MLLLMFHSFKGEPGLCGLYNIQYMHIVKHVINTHSALYPCSINLSLSTYNIHANSDTHINAHKHTNSNMLAPSDSAEKCFDWKEVKATIYVAPT